MAGTIKVYWEEMPINVTGPDGIKEFSNGCPFLMYILPDCVFEVKSCVPTVKSDPPELKITLSISTSSDSVASPIWLGVTFWGCGNGLLFEWINAAEVGLSSSKPL